MEFNSQICTTKEQSERLMNLGLKWKTADIVIRPDNTLIVINENSFIYHNLERAIQEGYCPAWSLHRLWELAGIKRIELDLEDEIRVIYNGMIDTVERLIKKEYFNKEYLEK